jgi:rhamnosyltransferase
MTRPRVSVVVPTLDAAADLPALAKAFAAQKPAPPDEWLIVDSGSRDDTRRLAGDLGARVVEWDQPFDHGLTRDAGVAAAAGEIVVLTVQDARPADERWLQRLTAPLADPTIAGACGRQIPPPDGPLELRLKRLRDEQALKSEGLGYSVVCLRDAPGGGVPSPAERLRLYRFDNVCSALRRSVWEKIPFGSRRYAEDVIWCRDVLAAGYGVATVPAALTIHAHERSFAYEFRRALLDDWVLDRELGLRPPLKLHVFKELWKAKPADERDDSSAPKNVSKWPALRVYAAHGTARLLYRFFLRPSRLAERLVPRWTKGI